MGVDGAGWCGANAPAVLAPAMGTMFSTKTSRNQLLFARTRRVLVNSERSAADDLRLLAIDLATPLIGLILVVIGTFGIRNPDRWGRFYRRFFDRQSKLYRNLNPEDLRQRELATRFSVIWIVGGGVFVLGWAAAWATS